MVLAPFYLMLSVILSCSDHEGDTVPSGQDVYVDGVHAFVPTNGFVPDSMTAVRIAEAVLTPIYGTATVAQQQPLVATLRDTVWTIRGSIPDESIGGVALVELSKSDARVLRVTHGL